MQLSPEKIASVGIEISDCKNFKIVENKISGFDEGIRVTESDGNLKNNNITGNKIGLNVEKNSFVINDGNHFDGNQIPHQVTENSHLINRNTNYAGKPTMNNNLLRGYTRKFAAGYNRIFGR